MKIFKFSLVILLHGFIMFIENVCMGITATPVLIIIKRLSASQLVLISNTVYEILYYKGPVPFIIETCSPW